MVMILIRPIWDWKTFEKLKREPSDINQTNLGLKGGC